MPHVPLPKAVIWDMDGTLTDSEPLWARATFEMSEHMGKRLTVEQHARTTGGTFDNTFRICAEAAGIEQSENTRKFYREFLFTRVAELFSQELRLNPGVSDVLDALGDAGIPLLVATNTPRELADAAIAAVGTHRFVATVCGDEVARPKPAPDIYLRAATCAGASPAECLVFEDSLTGMTAARDAGCAVVGLPATPDSPVADGVVTLAETMGDSRLVGADFRQVGLTQIATIFKMAGARVRGQQSEV